MSVAVNILLQLNFILPLFLGVVLYDNDLKQRKNKIELMCINIYLLWCLGFGCTVKGNYLPSNTQSITICNRNDSSCLHK